ncbi:MAG: ABC transporter ATP-binding protein [Thermodesulfobacteriota bacterium]
MLFQIENLTKSFAGRRVLDLPELWFEKGRVTGLLGPNGAGKTTLLEILSFLLSPDGGRLVYDSREVDYSSPGLRELRREVVLVPQTPIMFTATVYKNVEFGLKVRKTPKGEREKIIYEVLELVGLRGLAGARADKLSGGETQRAAIARALACSPRVLFFDEPTANVDVENRITIENIIRDINVEKGLSIILTTHDPLQAARLADRVIFLFEGRLAASPYENIFTGTIVEENGSRYCLVQNRVRFPVQTARTGRVRISVDPWLVRPAGEGADEAAGLTGRLIQVTDEGDRVRLLVNVGLPLSLLMEKEEYRRHPLPAGEEVTLACPSRAVEVL